MRLENSYCHKIFGVICCLIALCAVGFAQSGRTVVTPTPTPTPEVKTSNTETAKNNTPCEKRLEEVLYVPPKKPNEFVEELNRLGKCGYRLEKAARIPFGIEPTGRQEIFVSGVVKFDSEDIYEYNWFVASRPGEIVTIANNQAEQGFYFGKQMLFIYDSGYRRGEESSGGLGDLSRIILSSGYSGSVFIFERKNRVIKKNEYRVLDGVTDRSKESLARNQETLNEHIARGYRPVGVFYLGMWDQFAVIMEKDAEIKPEGEYLLFKQTYFMSKNLTKRSKEGYKPLFIGFRFALLHRMNNQPLMVSYDSAEAFGDLAKKLPKLIEKGADYQTTGIANYSCYDYCDPFEGKPFFAIPTASKNKKSDIRILEMTNVYERTKKKEKDASYLESPTQEKLVALQTLLKEGYIIRDIFFSKEVTVLFERPMTSNSSTQTNYSCYFRIDFAEH
jgi:hypothetical protein